MKTNKEKNIEHDARMQERMRPKQPAYDFTALEAVMRQWVTMNEPTWTTLSPVCSIWCYQ